MLDVNGLSHRLGGRKIFNDLSLHARPGQHIVIVGDSGSGKSTLLKLIAENKSAAIKVPTSARSAMVLQEGALLDHLTVIENLRLVKRFNAGKPSPEPKDVLRSLKVDEHLFNHPVTLLSGGQQRRVAIARALMCEPQILLFDEPDAGLDVINLANLAAQVNHHSKGRVAITVSHNPIYIAQVAHTVYRLEQGKLVLVAEHSSLATSEDEALLRQNHLQLVLSQRNESETESLPSNVPTEVVIAVNSNPSTDLLRGLSSNALSLLQKPRSISDQLGIASYVFYLSCLTGLLFLALVGLMLGGTTIAVVKLLADNALQGFVGLFLNADDLLEMMGGVYVLYLAPPIGGMLFAARSGSIVTSWLGQLEYARKIQALRYLDVPTNVYIRAPAIWAMFLSMMLCTLWFTLAVWLGGVVAAYHLFDVQAPIELMALASADVELSHFSPKILGYSIAVAFITIAMGLAKKTSAHCVNMHTTKAIVYSTLGIAVAELIIILWR